MKMPFGKHKGTEIEDCPKRYLYWLNSQEWCRDYLKLECKEVLEDWTPPRKQQRLVSEHLVGDMFIDQYGIYEYNDDATGPDDEKNYIDYFVPNM